MDHLHNALSSTQISQIDQVLVDPLITEQETLNGCNIALDLEISNVWVKPCYLHQTINLFRTSSLNIGTLIGYPFGGSTTYAKLAETKRALSEGVSLLAVSLNVGDIVAGNDKVISQEISNVSGITHMNSIDCLVSVNVSLLEAPQILKTAVAAIKAGADGLILEVNNLEGFNIEQLSDLLKELHKKMIKTSLHIPSMFSMEDIDAILYDGFERLGMPVNMTRIIN